MAFLYSIRNENGLDSSNSNNSNESTLINQSSNSNNSNSDNRSSVSIPWAADAIKQNQMEFEKIERIFYCEEDLPTDSKTREEFLEWMEAFPHLRIIGKKIPIYFEPRGPVSSYEFQEEVLAIHPSRHHQQKQKHRSNYNTSDNFNSTRRDYRRTEQTNSYPNESLFGKKSSSSNTNIGNLNNEITRYLKISPSPALKRRYATKIEKEPINLNTKREQPQRLQFDPQNPYYLKIPSAEGSRLINVKNSTFLTSSSSNLLATPQFTQGIMKASQSANNIRMPPILTFKIEETQPNNLHVIKSAVVGKLNHEIISLPQLSETPKNGRSISAVTLKKSNLTQNYPNNTSNNIKVVKFS